MADTSDGYIYGLDEFIFKGKKFGMISEDGMTPGGSAPSKTQIRGAQVRNAVVKTLVTQPGNKVFNFNLIQLKTTDGWKDCFGGEVDASGVYSAPAVEDILEGPAVIKCASGHTIVIKNATLTPNLAGAINLAQTLQIQCELEFLIPPDGTTPYQVYPPGQNPPGQTGGE